MADAASTEATAAAVQALSVPADKALRDDLRRRAHDYCAGCRLVPPLALDEISEHAGSLLRQAGADLCYLGFASVLIGNEVWRDVVAATPFNRRILLLPQCVRSSRACQASRDAVGLLCEACGNCPVGDIQEQAEQLGYVVLVAEGTTAVRALLSRGQAEAIVGVSCLSALERSFRPLTAHAVPGLAVPLLHDGCSDTRVDLDWLRETMALRRNDRRVVTLDLDGWQRQVLEWFQPARLRDLLGHADTDTGRLAADWLARGGKRWRPLLSRCVYEAMQAPSAAPAVPDMLVKLAVAVECFHKASLVHDDIEDDDSERYGEPTLHRRHGVPIALNVGDLLIGEGYRLIAGCGAAPEAIRQMTAVAADGHRTLCLGQGAELVLRREPDRLSSIGVLEIFREKTAPAFEVAMQLGALAAHADDDTRAVLTAFSEALGLAYQIRDDLEDLTRDQARTPGGAGQPSILLALAREEIASSGGQAPLSPSIDEIRRTRAETLTRGLFEKYSAESLRALRPLRNANLKRLLFRVATRILNPPSP